MYPKIFVGPVTLNTVDAAIEFSNDTDIPIGMVASRRQIECSGGYVNNWTTRDFSRYVKSKTNNITLVRDHGGPEQGSISDDGKESLKEDCLNMDGIHLDVFKKTKSISDAVDMTSYLINFCNSINDELFYEVGTEQSISKYESEDLDYFLYKLKSNLGPVFKKVRYAVIQSGTALKENTNVGNFDLNRLKKMVSVCNEHGVISKEHNGDYLDSEQILSKFRDGLGSLNIAPEFGYIESKILYDEMDSDHRNMFFDLCLKSGKWKKWIDGSIDPKYHKEKIIMVSGHYVHTSPLFIKIKDQISSDINIDIKIKNEIKNRLKQIT